jgi:hypothetical protein
MPDGFVVSLGAGLYLDAAGNLTTGPQTPLTQVYKAAGGLKLDTDKISKTIHDIGDFLSNDKTQEKIRELGFSPNTLSIVLKAAQAGAIAASFASIAFIGLGIVLQIISETQQADGISPATQKVLLGLQNDTKAIDDELIANSMLTIHSQVNGAADFVSQTLMDIVIPNLKGDARIPKLEAMQTKVNGLNEALSSLFVQSWSPLFRIDDYKNLFFLSPWLYTRNLDGSNASLLTITPTVRRFDYRLGVPMYAYIATIYPILVSAGLPWYRSSGHYAGNLRRLASSIDDFVKRINSESLARTVHTPQSLFESVDIDLITNERFHMNDSLHNVNVPLPRDRYLVGAVDLVRYTDEWFAAQWIDQVSKGYDGKQYGALNTEWQHPSMDDEAANEANEQSAQDFADLQVASGMIHLMTAAARLRYLSTPPLASETVSGSTSIRRQFVEEEATDAVSPWIFPIGTITRPAKLQRFEARARARIQTQLPGFSIALNYRIRLVSVDNRRGDAWGGHAYLDNVWNGSYVSASGNPQDKRLDIQIFRNRLLSSHLLYEGPSPTSTVNLERTLTMKASTFDWYVPPREYVLPWDLQVWESSTTALKSGAGAQPHGNSESGVAGSISAHVIRERFASPWLKTSTPRPSAQTFEMPLSTPSNVESNLGDVLEEFKWTDQPLPGGAERRWVRQENVELHCKLAWEDGQLNLSVHGSPQYRPYQLYVIVEEDVYSGETIPDNIEDILQEQSLRTELHSAFPLEIVSQLTIVPKEFFEAEHLALTSGKKLWDDLKIRFAKSRGVGRQPPSPGDFERRLYETVGGSQATASLAEKQNRRFAFIQEHVPDALGEVLRESGIEQINIPGLDTYR